MSESAAGSQIARELPCLEIRVGVSGHRSGGLARADPTLLCAAVDGVLRDISVAAAQVQCERQAALAGGEPLCRIISALADGSDQLVAERAMIAGYELQCPLPFSRDEYARDFSDDVSRSRFADLLSRASAVLELDGSRADQDAAYERAGRVMLCQSDIVVGIWNGEVARGRGGTAHILREATAFGMPVVWIHAHAPHACKLLMRSDTVPETRDLSAISLLNEVRRSLAPDPQSAAMVEEHATSVLWGGEAQSSFGFGDSTGLWRSVPPNRSRVRSR